MNISTSLHSNCVGKGNRRWYWLFLLSGTVFCLLYFIGAKYTHQYHTCADDASLSQGWALWNMFAREYCAFTRQSMFYLLTWVTAWFGCYFLLLLQVQVTCVARETTFQNVSGVWWIHENK